MRDAAANAFMACASFSTFLHTSAVHFGLAEDDWAAAGETNGPLVRMVETALTSEGRLDLIPLLRRALDARNVLAHAIVVPDGFLYLGNKNETKRSRRIFDAEALAKLANTIDLANLAMFTVLYGGGQEVRVLRDVDDSRIV